MKKQWEHFSHGADIGVRGFGRSREEAFEQAALALTNVVTDSKKVGLKEEIEIICEAPDDEFLLADWLNALILEMSSGHMLFGKFKVQKIDHQLHGQAWGEKVDRAKHRPAVEVKGATYTELKVKQNASGVWIAQCVVDV